MGEESWILAVLDGRYVAGYVRRWEDAAGGYRKKVFLGVVLWVPQPISSCYTDAQPEAEVSGHLLAGKGLCGGSDSVTPKTTPENGLVRGYET